MPSRAHEFFRQIVEGDNPARFLQELVDSRHPENEFLEFKGASRIGQKQIREFWSQALSGFANTEGGVLIWRVRAARIQTPDEPSRRIDVASELDLVPDPTAFEQSLKDLLLEAVIEPLPGIEFARFTAGREGEDGFVVCFVPEGSHKPYRAQLAASRQYYQRIGDSFVMLPHSLLRSLFYPRIGPVLSISITAMSSAEAGSASVTFDASISNAGKGTARDVCVLVESPMKAEFSPHSHDVQGLGSHSRNQGPFRLGQNLHPGQLEDLFTCRWSGKSTSIISACAGGGSRHSERPSLTEARFRMRVFSLDQAEQELEVTFDDDELAHGAIKEARMVRPL